MGFQVFYIPCRFGTEPVEHKNPFTGEVRTILPPKPLSPDDVKAVWDVLRGVTDARLDGDGFVNVPFDDGGLAVVSADHLETGCAITLRRDLSPDLLRFLFDLLKAADWVMFPAMEGNPAITVLTGRAGGFAESFPEVVCKSAEELGAILGGGYSRWKSFRDQVVERSLRETS